MRVILADIQGSLVSAWSKSLEGLENVAIHSGSIFDVACDAIVSPANSFGFMDGGIDAAICDRFGWVLQKRVQDQIRARFHGELLVGQALIVPTDDKDVPYLISAPTMRVPMHVNDTVNAYLAARAVLLLVQTGRFEDGSPIADSVKTVAVPGLGTGIGEVSVENCAAQMRAAFDDFLSWRQDFPATLMQASQRHYVEMMPK